MVKGSYEVVVFDFDGTLFDTFPGFQRAMKKLAGPFRYRSITLAEGEALRHQTPEEILRVLEIAPWKVPLLAWAVRRELSREIDTIDCFSGIPEVLTTLRRRIPVLAIATSNSARNVHRLLQRKQLDFFNHTICGIGLSGKAGRLQALVRQLRVSPGAVLYVGDEVRDLQAARQVGMAAGMVTWGYNKGGRLARENPDYLFHTPAQILDGLFPSG